LTPPAEPHAPAVAAAAPPLKPPSRLALTLAVLAPLLIWAFNFLIAKQGMLYLDPVSMAAFRVVLAGALIGGIFLAMPGPRNVPRRGDLWRLAQLGLFGVGINQVLFTVGLNYTTVGHSSLIIGAGPISILLLAWLHGLEKLTARKIAGMAICFAGVAVLASEAGLTVTTHAGERSGTWLGDLITFVGSLAFAMFAVRGKKFAGRYDSLSVTTFAHLTGAVIILPLAIRQAWVLDWGAVGWQGWAALAYMASMASVTAYFIWYWALRHMEASRLGVFGYFQPLLATGLGVLLLGEPVTRHLLSGGVLIIAGVLLAELRSRHGEWTELRIYTESQR
jgi:drug/metabolite transporter (DMT)-like permease